MADGNKTFPLTLQGESNEEDILVGIILPLAFASTIVAGRLYSRYLAKNQGWDDLLIFMASLFAVALVSLVGTETLYGLGHSYSNIPVRLRVIGIRISYATIACYQTSLVLTKLSILFFYLRILTLPYQRYLIISTMVVVCLYGSTFFILTFFICNPVNGGYEFDIKVGLCRAYYPIMIASAVLHTATDLWMLGLVLPHIIRMHLPPIQKTALVFVLTLGFFVACASLTRMSVALRFVNPKYAQWDSLSFAIWTTLESSLGLICASVPMLKPVVRLLMGQQLASRPKVNANVPRTLEQRKSAIRRLQDISFSLFSGTTATPDTDQNTQSNNEIRDVERGSGLPENSRRRTQVASNVSTMNSDRTSHAIMVGSESILLEPYQDSHVE